MHGFFGKIPSHRDFITRDLPRRFLDVWDGWLQNGIAESKAQLGEAWLDAYLTSPIWRFALGAGICGEAWAGILMPSVDGVGRYFPFTIATPVDREIHPFQIAAGAGAWFDAVENLALRTLDDDHFEANGMQSALATVADVELLPQSTDTAATAYDAFSLAVHGAHGDEVPAALAHALTAQRAPVYSLWWNAGAESAAPSALIVDGLPDPRSFVDLLHASWGAGELPAPGGARAAASAAAEADALNEAQTS